MKQSDKRLLKYNEFVKLNEKYFSEDNEKLYNFRCVAGRLLNSIPNYEFWVDEKDSINAISSFKMVLKSYIELKLMDCLNLPKLSELCKNTTYIKNLF